jgi:hypothetical protein
MFCVQKMDQLRDYLPDMSWMKEYLPESDTLQRASDSLRDALAGVRSKMPEKVRLRLACTVKPVNINPAK